MDKTYNEIKNILNDAEVSIIEDSVKVIFKNGVLFETGKSELKPESNDLFKRFANLLDKYNKTNILVIGHTDSDGLLENNQILSENRATASKNKLIEYKIDSHRLTSWGLADTKPLASNNTEEGKAKNRRVEFIVLYSYHNLD